MPWKNFLCQISAVPENSHHHKSGASGGEVRIASTGVAKWRSRTSQLWKSGLKASSLAKYLSGTSIRKKMQEQVAKRIVTIAGEVLSASLVLMDRLQKPNHLELELITFVCQVVCQKSRDYRHKEPECPGSTVSATFSAARTLSKIFYPGRIPLNRRNEVCPSSAGITSTKNLRNASRKSRPGRRDLVTWGRNIYSLQSLQSLRGDVQTWQPIFIRWAAHLDSSCSRS